MLLPCFVERLKDPEFALGRRPPPEERAYFRALAEQTRGDVPEGVSARDLEVPGAAGPLRARLYTPDGLAAPSGFLIYIHGGGWVIGDIETYDGLCRRFAAWAGVRVIALSYRLAPEHPFPAGHDDAQAATRWVLDHAAELGADPNRIAIGGDSAGGNLATVTTLALNEAGDHRIAFQLLLYPATGPGMTKSIETLSQGYFLDMISFGYFGRHVQQMGHPDVGRMAPALSPHLAGMPPAAIFTAEFDPLKDDGAIFAQRLRDAGVAADHQEFPGLIHGFYTMSGLDPAIEQAVRVTAERLKSAIG